MIRICAWWFGQQVWKYFFAPSKTLIYLIRTNCSKIGTIVILTNHHGTMNVKYPHIWCGKNCIPARWPGWTSDQMLDTPPYSAYPRNLSPDPRIDFSTSAKWSSAVLSSPRWTICHALWSEWTGFAVNFRTRCSTPVCPPAGCEELCALCKHPDSRKNHRWPVEKIKNLNWVYIVNKLIRTLGTHWWWWEGKISKQSESIIWNKFWFRLNWILNKFISPLDFCFWKISD